MTTILVSNINAAAGVGSAPGNIRVAGSGGRVVFIANDGISGTELWRSDGTAAGATSSHAAT